MKICFYDGDMNINRKYEKKYVEIQKKKKKKKIFQETKRLKHFFESKCFKTLWAI